MALSKADGQPLQQPSRAWSALQPLAKGFAGFLQKALIPEHVAVIAPEASVAAVELEGLFSAVTSFQDLSLLTQQRPKVSPSAMEVGIGLNRLFI